MHIGFLTSEYPHPRINRAAGIGTSIKNLAEALVAHGVHVSVFVYDQEEDAVFLEAGIHFHLIKKKKYKFLGWYLYRKKLQKYLNKIISKEKINAIEAPDWTGITAFMKINCPLVMRFHGSDAYFCNLEKRQQKPKNYWFEKEAIFGADYLLSVSKFTAERTRAIFNFEKPIEVIPNSVDVQKFKPIETTPIENRILYFGSIIRKKGVLELAEIFNEVQKQIPEATLVIAGKDVTDLQTGKSTKDSMQEIFTPEAGKKVDFLGNLTYEEVQQQLAEAAIVVLPSFAEALPMTWLEAMAMEKALVTSNIGWAEEVMVDEKTGFTEDPSNIEAYAEKIIKLLKDPALAEQMGKAARQQVKEKFSTEVVVMKNIGFYERVGELKNGYSV